MSSGNNPSPAPVDENIVNLADRQAPPSQNRMLVRANRAMEGLQASFLEEARSQLALLEDALAGVKAAGDDCVERDRCFIAVYGAAHEIRGQAGSFDYGLLTIVCGSLCDLIELYQKQSARPDLLAPMQLHVSMIVEILDRDLKGDGGKFGAALNRQITQLNRLLQPQMQH
ncbi:MAG: Hpt domain-containing protein [Alphaproteobacteria bacterium]